MIFDFNNFLIQVSPLLDHVEIEMLNVTPLHSKRVVYLLMEIGKGLKLSNSELIDLATLGFLHDSGHTKLVFDNKVTYAKLTIIELLEKIKEHCILGEENIKGIPFLTEFKNVLKYHHENYDGSGYYELRGGETPIFSQMISFVDHIDSTFNLGCEDRDRFEIIEKIKNLSGKRYNPEIVDIFIKRSERISFWLNLQNQFIDMALEEIIPKNRKHYSIKELYNLISVFSKIIDSKSRYTYTHSIDIAEKVLKIVDNLKFSEDRSYKLGIAALLHEVGKLAIPSTVLDKPGKLTQDELNEIYKYPYYTRFALKKVDGFSKIAEWAGNHKERLNGKGFPYGIEWKKLDFESKLLATLDIYQALREKRSYRDSYNHKKSIAIMHDMGKKDLLDPKIIDIVDKNLE